MQVKKRALNTITPYEGNPRTIPDEAVAAVAESLRQFGFRQPIVVDAAGVIIVGHARYLAAKKLGLAKVPVHVAADLTAEQIRAYRLADNKTAELSEWADPALAAELRALAESELDLKAFGFTAEEIERLTAATSAESEEVSFTASGESLPEQWLIVVTCKNEREQKRLLKRFEKEGLACEPVIS